MGRSDGQLGSRLNRLATLPRHRWRRRQFSCHRQRPCDLGVSWQRGGRFPVNPETQHKLGLQRSPQTIAPQTRKNKSLFIRMVRLVTIVGELASQVLNRSKIIRFGRVVASRFRKNGLAATPVAFLIKLVPQCFSPFTQFFRQSLTPSMPPNVLPVDHGCIYWQSSVF